MYPEAYANHFSGVQVMATINLQCNYSLLQIHSSVFFMQAENNNIMTGGAYMGEMLLQVWLKSIKK